MYKMAWVLCLKGIGIVSVCECSLEVSGKISIANGQFFAGLVRTGRTMSGRTSFECPDRRTLTSLTGHLIQKVDIVIAIFW